MEFSTSPWNIKTKSKESFDYSQKTPEVTVENSTFPSLFLDALGGGKPKSPYSRKNSPQLLENSNIDEDDRPPVSSIFSLNPSMTSTTNTPPLFHQTSYSVNTPLSTTPLKNATSVTLLGFPPYKWNQVLDLAKSLDTVVSFRKSDDQNGNWMVITFATRQGVLAIKEYDGQLIDNSWVLTVKMGELFSIGTLERISSLKPQPLKISPETSNFEKAKKENKLLEKESRKSMDFKTMDFKPMDLEIENSYQQDFIRPSYWNQFLDLIFSW